MPSLFTCGLNMLWAKHKMASAYFKVLPDGWFSEKECAILYQMAKENKGPILEIGSFVGRTTTCIALGIRDSFPKDFYTTDLHFEKAEDYIKFYRPIHGNDYLVPDKLIYYLEHGGTLFNLRDNLKKNDLLKYVNIIKGDFRHVLQENKKYNLIFCDASHDLKEISLNMKSINDVLLPGGSLLCHDVVSAAQVELINTVVNIKSYWISVKLYVGRKRPA